MTRREAEPPSPLGLMRLTTLRVVFVRKVARHARFTAHYIYDCLTCFLEFSTSLFMNPLYFIINHFTECRDGADDRAQERKLGHLYYIKSF